MGSLDIGQYTRDAHRFSRHLLESMKAGICHKFLYES